MFPGDTLFLYTDGITEAQDERKNFFEMERLTAFLRTMAEQHLSPREINQELRNELRTFVGNAEQFDDITAVTLRILSLSGADRA